VNSPEQALRIWEQVPLERVRLNDASGPAVLENAPEIDPVTRDKVMSHLADAFAQASGAPVEQHATAFGAILVVTLGDPQSPCLRHRKRLADERAGGASHGPQHGHDLFHRNARRLIASDIAGMLGIFHAAKSGREPG